MSTISRSFSSPKTEETETESKVMDSSAQEHVSQPQNLSEAIRYVVQQYGKEYLLNKNMLNMLNDFHILKDMPAAKHVIKNMQANGYVEKIITVSNWELESKSIIAQYVYEFGAKEEIVEFIIHSIGYGLKLSKEKTVVIKENNSNKFDDPLTRKMEFSIDTPEEKKDYVSTSIAEMQNNIRYDDFFPLFGVKLGQTTWKQIEDLGGKVEISGSPSRCADYNNLSLWDYEGDGKFIYLSWSYYGPDFPDSWKSKGFSWDNSYNEWLEVLRRLGFNILVTKKPVVTRYVTQYSNYDTLKANVRALTPDDSLLFELSFGYRESLCKTSSPQTLFSIDLKYLGPSRRYSDNKNSKNSKYSNIDNFFPLLGITLGKTTWREAEEMGCKVEVHKEGPSRVMYVGQIHFWDHKGVGVFTSIHWVRLQRDFPDSWKSKGFSWDNSYDEWIAVFEKLNYKITVTLKTHVVMYKGREILKAKFQAMSPDGTLSFILDFGEDGSLKSSPNTLYSIDIEIEKKK